MVASVRLVAMISSDFSVTIGSCKQLALSLYMFILVVDYLTREPQKEVCWFMLFADDIFLIDKTQEGPSRKLDTWKKAFERNGF